MDKMILLLNLKKWKQIKELQGWPSNTGIQISRIKSFTLTIPIFKSGKVHLLSLYMQVWNFVLLVVFWICANEIDGETKIGA